MAITFHEGLPGAGKTYEAVLSFILPAVKSGRAVYTNIRGVDPDAIAAYLGIAPVFVRSVIHTIEHDSRDEDSRELVEDFLLKAPPDSLIIWDEIQNFYPPSRQALSHRVTQFVTEHRHSGHDIILMGQHRMDVHAIWRRRIEQVITFRKLSYLGWDKGYRYTVYQAIPPDKWESVVSGTRSYDKRIFSLYSSFRAETQNKALLKSEKTIFSSWQFRYALPVFALLAVWGITTAASYFEPVAHDAVPVAPASTPPALAVPVKPGMGYGNAGAVAQPAVVSSSAVVASDLPEHRSGMGPGEYLASLFTVSEAFVVGYVVSQDQPDRWFGEVVFYDRSGHPAKRFSRVALAELGAVIEPREYGFLMTLPQGQHVIPYRTSQERNYSGTFQSGSFSRVLRDTGTENAAPSATSGGVSVPVFAGPP